MIDNVVYERIVPECVKMGYLQQQKYKRILTQYPYTLLGSLPSPHPHSKINRGHATVVPNCTQNENSAPLYLCIVSLCVYAVGFIL